MSMSDSDSQYPSEFKTFREVTQDRLLHEMLGSVKKGNTRSTWKVLIMDRFTVKIVSCACKMADITEVGVSLVEDIYKRRQPLPSMEAVYFIQPSKENIDMFMSDMAGKTPLYKKAYVFFSSPIERELISHIKKDTTILPRIGALSEMNLEYFAIDSQGFLTDNERALEELFGDEDNHRKVEACLHVMASRIATAFASIRELPFVRYRAAKSLDPTMVTTYRDLLPTKLAAYVWNNLVKYKTTITNFPMTETCDLIILDRSVDQIAPFIHEWTYDAMCHDLLNLDGNKYVHEVPSKTGGPPEKKEALLAEHDPIWLELRHLHIADASERLHNKMANFASKNKTAAHIGSRHSGELSTRDLHKVVQSLPQYSEQMDKLSLHVEIAGKINSIIREQSLKDVGQLEQDLVFGDAGTKEIINFLKTRREDISRENKLRLLMVYAACYPDKLEGENGSKLVQLAGLTEDDMNAVNNMKFLGSPPENNKKSSIGGFSLKFDSKKKRSARKERRGEEESWQLSRFYPMIEELIENLCRGELPRQEYSCMNDPTPVLHSMDHPGSIKYNETPAHSKRSRRTATWARPRTSEDGYSSDSILRRASSDFVRRGRRVFVFIIGGATRSEMRVCHKLSMKLNRDIILGSSSIDDPVQFITKLKMLSMNELSLDDLDI